MTVGKINIVEAIANIKKLMEKEKTSPALTAAIETLLLVLSLLIDKLGLNSSNSSIPPSSDPNRNKNSKNNKEGRKAGGQKGRTGKTLTKEENPDEIKEITINKKNLPAGKYSSGGYESRQIVEIEIFRNVIEYRAEVLINEKGKRFVASFPEGIGRPIQYGSSIKAQSVYLSQYQLLPYNRIEDYFGDQAGIPLSSGSIYNFNREVYNLLEPFEAKLCNKLKNIDQAHADETGVNINGKNHWLHSFGNTEWTYLYPHKRRGKEAMNEMGIMPEYKGRLSHDHWKPYYHYKNITHSLCNAHHLRELERIKEKDEHKWAKQIQDLLLEMNIAVHESENNMLTSEESDEYRAKYREILETADETECPPPKEKEVVDGKKKKGKTPKTKARNLLERLRDFEDDTLRFIDDPLVPFTNNQGENDLRMTKVQQKISGCFRSFDGAKIFCRIRSYLSTCKKQGISLTEALTYLFKGQLPPEIEKNLMVDKKGAE